jgi:hypothetical protein
MVSLTHSYWTDSEAIVAGGITNVSEIIVAIPAARIQRATKGFF